MHPRGGHARAPGVWFGTRCSSPSGAWSVSRPPPRGRRTRPRAQSPARSPTRNPPRSSSTRPGRPRGAGDFHRERDRSRVASRQPARTPKPAPARARCGEGRVRGRLCPARRSPHRRRSVRPVRQLPIRPSNRARRAIERRPRRHPRRRDRCVLDQLGLLSCGCAEFDRRYDVHAGPVGGVLPRHGGAGDRASRVVS